MRVISHIAAADAFGVRWVIFRYEDGTTKKWINGRVVSRSTAAPGPTWWRYT